MRYWIIWNASNLDDCDYDNFNYYILGIYTKRDIALEEWNKYCKSHCINNNYEYKTKKDIQIIKSTDPVIKLYEGDSDHEIYCSEITFDGEFGRLYFSHIVDDVTSNHYDPGKINFYVGTTKKSVMSKITELFDEIHESDSESIDEQSKKEFVANLKNKNMESIEYNSDEYYVCNIYRVDVRDNNFCEICEKKQILHELHLENDIICPHCKNIKHKLKSICLNICSLKCKGFNSSQYIIPVKSSGYEIKFCLQKDKCSDCGKRDSPIVIFKGEHYDLYK